MCYSLFTYKKANENKENSNKKEKNNSKLNLNLNLKSIKPKHLNNLNLNFLNHSHLKSKNNPSFTRLISSNKANTSQILLNKLNYSPSNILSNKNPIIINKIGLSIPILKFETKFNNSNSTIEQDISIIKNIKGLSINNLNYNINFSDKKIMPSIFSSPTNFDNNIKFQNNKKKKIFQMKKKVLNDINNFENKIDKIKNNNNESKEQNKTINSFENENNTIDKRDINNENKNNENNKKVITFNEENKIHIFDKKNKTINNKTFYKYFKNGLDGKNLKNDINLNEKYSSIQNLKSLKYKLNNNHLENQNVMSLNGNKIENKKESSKKLENKNPPENFSTKENINNNKAKMARLSRLKNLH